MARCEFIDPNTNVKCTIAIRLTRILFISPIMKMPIVYHACERHGDMRFRVLSRSEDEVTKLKDSTSISWTEFSEKMKQVRWLICRRCHEGFKNEDVVWIIEYFAIRNDIQLRMRRSFRVHQRCANSEMTLYQLKTDKANLKKLDSF